MFGTEKTPLSRLIEISEEYEMPDSTPVASEPLSTIIDKYILDKCNTEQAIIGYSQVLKDGDVHRHINIEHESIVLKEIEAEHPKLSTIRKIIGNVLIGSGKNQDDSRVISHEKLTNYETIVREFNKNDWKYPFISSRALVMQRETEEYKGELITISNLGEVVYLTETDKMITQQFPV